MITAHVLVRVVQCLTRVTYLMLWLVLSLLQYIYLAGPSRALDLVSTPWWENVVVCENKFGKEGTQ